MAELKSVQCDCDCGFQCTLVCDKDAFPEYCPSCGLDGYRAAAIPAADNDSGLLGGGE